jgi:hypothetical protein
MTETTFGPSSLRWKAMGITSFWPKAVPRRWASSCESPARLIVTDWEMSGMDGGELCRRVRCIPAFAQLPILVLSGAPEPVSGPVCWSVYFRQPVDLPSLMFAIDTFVAARLTSPSIRLACSEPAPPAGRLSKRVLGRSGKPGLRKHSHEAGA